MFFGKNILVVGAGNAGRPVANLFNYLKKNVIVTDSNSFDNLPKKAQKKIELLENRGITFELGDHNDDLLDFPDAVYISPNIPKTADFVKKIYELSSKGKFDIIENKDVGNILNSLIAIPMVGIAGTDGKTTTTNMINFALKDKFNTLIFSSLQDSLVIEGLVEMVVNSECENKDLAIFELPHGTIRMADGLELDFCVITNLTPDHMDEFENYEDYITRNIAIEKLLKKNGLVLANGDDPIISSRLDTFNHDCIVYGLQNPQTVEFEGNTYYNDNVDYDILATNIKLNGLDGSSYKIKSGDILTLVCNNCGKINYDLNNFNLDNFDSDSFDLNDSDSDNLDSDDFDLGICKCDNYSRKVIPSFEREVNIKVPGLINVENSLATILSSLVMGIDLDDAINRMSSFKGVKGRFEKIDKLNGVNIFMDAAHNPESMEKLFSGFDISGKLILSLDNPDTLTSRDKYKIGEVLGKVVDVLIVSSKNETTEFVDNNAAFEVLNGAFNVCSDIETYVTENVSESIFNALSIADTGDTIIHIGPGVVNAYDNVKNDIKDAINFYEAISGKVVVIGGCGTVGSLIGRVLAANGIDVTISDSANETPLKSIFETEGIDLELGSEISNELLYNASSIFLAPSLMDNEKFINNLRNDLNNMSFEDIPVFGIDEIFKFFRSDKLVFGVTGTNGKTTTTEILKNIFKTAGLNVPEHYLNIQGNTEFIPSLQSKLEGDVAVIEIGTFGNAGEIETISKNAEVDTGIITNITQDHLSNGSFNDYVNCKKEIVDLADNLILCADDPIVASLGNLKDNEDLLFFGINYYGDIFKDIDVFKESRICPVCGKDLIYDIHYLGHLGNYHCDCGFKNPEIDIEARDIIFDKEDSSIKFTLKIYEQTADITLKNGSIANVYNSLAAATGAWLSGLDINDIADGINSFSGVNGRLEIINDNPKIILDYAHNPAGVKSVIQTVSNIIQNDKKLANGRFIIVNTISSESGDEGDLEIAKLLSKADIIIPASYSAFKSSKFINDFANEKCEIIYTESSKNSTKVGTLGASFEQVKEGLIIALNIINNSKQNINNIIKNKHSTKDKNIIKDKNNSNDKNIIKDKNINNDKSSVNDKNINNDKSNVSEKDISNDIILIIGEGGLKYSQTILSEVNGNKGGDLGI